MEFIKHNSANTCILIKEESKEPVVETKKSPNISYKKLILKKQVTWTEDTVDNEFMNRKKSKSIIILN
jgi:hypothetical protein